MSGFLDLSVQELLDLKHDVKTGRKVLDFKEQAALIDLALRAQRLRLQLEKERARVAEGEGLGL